MNDAAILAAKLENGSFLNVTLGSPKADGTRDLVVAVTQLPQR